MEHLVVWGDGYVRQFLGIDKFHVIFIIIYYYDYDIHPQKCQHQGFLTFRSLLDSCWGHG
jgi:hypothetical protein